MPYGDGEDPVRDEKGHKPDGIAAKPRQVDVLVSQGKSVADTIRAIGVTKVTYYRRRQEFGGLKSDQVKWMKDFEAENARLRRAAKGPDDEPDLIDDMAVLVRRCGRQGYRKIVGLLRSTVGWSSTTSGSNASGGAKGHQAS